MKFNRLFPVIAFVISLGFLPLTAAGSTEMSTIETVAQTNLIQLTTWFTGEFNNYEQHAEEEYARDKEGKDVDPHHHVHSIFAPIEIPALGTHVFHVQQSFGNHLDKIFRQRIYVFSTETDKETVRMKIYKYADPKPFVDLHKHPEALPDLDLSTLIDTDCCVIWEKDGDQFIGMNEGGMCRTMSQRLNKPIIVEDTITLKKDQIWLLDNVYDEDRNLLMGRSDGEPAKLRKCAFYNGWAAIKIGSEESLIGLTHLAEKEARTRKTQIEGERSIADTAEAETKTETAKKQPVFQGYLKLQLHNQGQRVPLVDKEGVDSGFELSLSQVTYAGSGTAVLKMGLHKSGEKGTVCYIWGEPEAPRLGMNLTWMQAGFTLDTQRLFSN